MDELYQDMLGKALISVKWSVTPASWRGVPVQIAHSYLFTPDWLFWLEWVWANQC